MNTDILNNYLKMGNISIPKYLLSNYKKLNITNDEFILLIYLLNLGVKIIYNPKMIAFDLNIDDKEIMNLLHRLDEKKIINIIVEKNERNVMEEYISLDIFYIKLSSLIMESKKENSTSNIFEMFESEFGRTLSPMEYEIINAWLLVPFSEEVILEALREATYNGVSNLRYIDKIIYEWKKKGFKTIEDVRKYNKDFKKVKPEKKELFDYNWLEDDGNN